MLSATDRSRAGKNPNIAPFPSLLNSRLIVGDQFPLDPRADPSAPDRDAGAFGGAIADDPISTNRWRGPGDVDRVLDPRLVLGNVESRRFRRRRGPERVLIPVARLVSIHVRRMVPSHRGLREAGPSQAVPSETLIREDRDGR